MGPVRLELDDPAAGESGEFVEATGNQAGVVQPVDAIQAGGLA